MKLRALMYHDVVEGSGDVYAVTPDAFRQQLDATGRAPGRTMDELRDGDWMITFDDGGSSALAVGEELARRSWRGHFFIATDLIGRPGYLDWDGVRAVAGHGPRDRLALVQPPRPDGGLLHGSADGRVDG